LPPSARGLELVADSGDALHARPAAIDDPGEAGQHELVLLTAKAQQLAGLAVPLLAPFGAETLVVTMQNGIPFWYFHGLLGPDTGRHLASVDPDGTLLRNLPLTQLIGSVVYPAAEVLAPKRVRLIDGSRFFIAALDGGETERLRELCRLCVAAGLKAPLQRDLRSKIWVKQWGNATLNPRSALTHATLGVLCRDRLMRDCATALMHEVQQVGEAVGARFRIPLAQRLAGAEAVGAQRISMLQDMEAGRARELDALLGAVRELGRMTATPTPRLATLHATCTLLARELVARGTGLRFVAP
jgi:2-dehydropantoate 2-reductase